MESGKKIKNARLAEGLTQKQLGSLIGSSYQVIAQWELGLREPKLRSIVRVANALKLNPLALLPDWFLDEVTKCS